MEQDLIEGSRIAQAHTATGGRFIAVGPDHVPGVNRIGLMSIHPRDGPDATLAFREAMNQGDNALKQFIAQHYTGVGWKTEEVLKGMMEARDFYGSEIVQVKTKSLHKGRFALVGDAGYSPGFTGAGTTLAIAGAYLLAGEVGKHKGNLAAGLRGYEEQMRPIIDDMQRVPPLVPGILAPQTAGGIWLRNNIFAFIAWSRILEFAQKYLAGAFASTDKFPLPDYEWVA